jgi:tRNA1(Val) A37 N6-methylase TrmN6
MAKKRLQTLGDVRRYLAGLLNRYEAGEIDEVHLKAAAYVSNILTSTIKDSDLEQRIEQLENNVKNSANNERARAAYKNP